MFFQSKIEKKLVSKELLSKIEFRKGEASFSRGPSRNINQKRCRVKLNSKKTKHREISSKNCHGLKIEHRMVKVQTFFQRTIKKYYLIDQNVILKR